MSELLEQTPPADKGQQRRRAGGRPGGDANAFATALAELALNVHSGAADPLTMITECAVDLIPGTEFSALVIPAGPGRLEARATSGPLTPEVIALQNDVGEGPCLDAVSQLGPVWVSDVAAESRWPLFTAEATRLGVGSMMCTPLIAQDRNYGSLSLASGRPDAFNEESRVLAAVFAANATIALADQEWRRNMTVALSSRDVIGQAKGILMERYRVTQDEAFALLVKASQRTHTKLRTVSDELCRTGVLPIG
ncbi:MAG TPA: GAF and ANTAR domain-containing protein [Jatrophihabitans sp.]|jgi:transcriptional regulator with GAF, ATPase, and Fis domain|uniref:GAF and ANTAR domain-containing protein n=1 Tax=Jatrophihabitans sp. TaxID=1932789 RepID=UPI002F0CAE08